MFDTSSEFGGITPLQVQEVRFLPTQGAANDLHPAMHTCCIVQVCNPGEGSGPRGGGLRHLPGAAAPAAARPHGGAGGAAQLLPCVPRELRGLLRGVRQLQAAAARVPVLPLHVRATRHALE